MTRELTIRLPSEISAWVRKQPGSCSETVLKLARSLWEGRRGVRLSDPGPGDDRLRLRASPRLLRFIRDATHSKDATVALRKLLWWGWKEEALPASSSPVKSLPVPRPSAATLGRSSLMPRPSVVGPGSPPKSSATRLLQTSTGRMIEFRDGHPVLGAAALSLSPIVADLVSRPRAPSEVPAGPLSPFGWLLRLIPERAFAIIMTVAVPFCFLTLLGFFGKWLTALNSAGKIASSASMKSAPRGVAAWTPQAATGLGRLFS